MNVSWLSNFDFGLIVGPMFCGKTSLLNYCLTYLLDTYQGKIKILRICYSEDVRANLINSREGLTSHHTSNYVLNEKIDIKKIKPEEIFDINIDNYDIIGIDEIQFYPDLRELFISWLKKGKKIICSGLDSTFEMKPFETVTNLYYLADELVKLKSNCNNCQKETGRPTITATFTARLTASKELIEVGGEDKYVATCRKHHFIVDNKNKKTGKRTASERKNKNKEEFKKMLKRE